mgnify:CR=1 FL=1
MRQLLFTSAQVAAAVELLLAEKTGRKVYLWLRRPMTIPNAIHGNFLVYREDSHLRRKELASVLITAKTVNINIQSMGDITMDIRTLLAKMEVEEMAG